MNKYPKGGNMIEVVCGVLIRDIGPRARILLTQRSMGKGLEYCWNTPGGKVNPGEELKEALERELMEEIGIKVLFGPELFTLKVSNVEIPKIGWIKAHHIAVEWDGDPKSLEGQGFGWFSEYETHKLSLTPADEKAFLSIRRYMRYGDSVSYVGM